MRCGGYDDADFDANSMCCACGGGLEMLVIIDSEDVELDFIEFSVEEMGVFDFIN